MRENSNVKSDTWESKRTGRGKGQQEVRDMVPEETEGNRDARKLKKAKENKTERTPPLLD
jgi:hypothetical protein